ncbi:membrane protein [Trichophyton mentagrophytes]|uniref:PH domain-containing protein n=1 Tax=Trichophyton interdigitale (strain MR816) TaxID=1215338 RepID=A0A059JDL7_TRIIM|nr:hypothetical protein H101_01206 [Trichophyton interdigitale H6]KDB25738.1 hypothetical protein H109_02435 [Trichophyton interdigitale MR816]GBF60753.1 membrane protein [Trichophyton mentagrophytes]
MASYIIGALSKKVLKESAENHFGKEDPYFESVPATNMFGQQKMKKRRRAAPEGISAHDAKILTKVKRRAYRLDLSLCNFCGIRFGWGSVIGLVPAFGDVVDALFALMVVMTCRQVEGGLPTNLQLQMVFNVFFDFVVGLIPFLGDLLDALYKCNTRNAVLLESYLKEKGQNNLARLEEGNRTVVTSGGRRPSMRRNNTEPPMYHDEPQRPSPARLPKENRRSNTSRSHRR